MSSICALCGKTPPDGFASITYAGVTKYYCHPDSGQDCYTLASHAMTKEEE